MKKKVKKKKKKVVSDAVEEFKAAPVDNVEAELFFEGGQDFKSDHDSDLEHTNLYEGGDEDDFFAVAEAEESARLSAKKKKKKKKGVGAEIGTILPPVNTTP